MKEFKATAHLGTKADHRKWYLYFRGIADTLDLKDWEFVIDENPCDGDDANATTWVYDSQRRGVISLSDSWRDIPPEKQRRIAVHELLHIHESGVEDLIRLGLEGILGSQAYDMFMKIYNDKSELMIDSIATAIAPFFPLPQTQEA